jgi:hypothetical protein
MKKKLSYRVPLLSSCGFDAIFQNKQSCIEISDVKVFGNFYTGHPNELRSVIVQRYSDNYTSPSGSTKEGRKIIANQLKNRIQRMKNEIAEFELIIQMCRKEKVQFKPTQQ